VGGSLGSLGQNLLGDLASSVLPGVISGLAGTLGDIGGAMDPSTLLGGGLDPTALDRGLDTTALGNGLSNGLDLTPTGSVIGTAPDGTPIDNAVLAQGDGAGVDLAAQDGAGSINIEKFNECMEKCYGILETPSYILTEDMRFYKYNACRDDCLAGS